ncbi:hypothetical protein G7Z17_g782 [Cylindrodendrum hubeiense]|uniref:NAD-dependent epimerase/dehydratase domain-containing protein n=1 Tax=Cylindrodendrum hubeiense TaxID=595255 RepID=A0A9P5HG13_9HYPO|nr:hypothetical protein G7Z17_g782 [Cylindrodendrum hubeiense]
MDRNLLITGAAGYIGGSILADFITRTTGPFSRANISAAVRSEAQVESLANLGINVVLVDLSDEASVTEVVLRNEIDIVLHTASSHDPNVASYLIKALGQRRKATGNETFFVHTSGSTAFAPEAGWPSGEMKDTDPIFETEKQLAANHPIRLTDIQVIEEGKTQGVTTLIVVAPAVYGRGTGQCKNMSIAFPIFIRSSIKDKLVHQFDKNGNPAAVHISDMTALYGLLVEKILQEEAIPNGEKGYYFAVAHKVYCWDLMQGFAERLHLLGLVAEPKTRTWPSDEMAAESLGVPPFIARVMGTHSTELVPVNAYEVGWRPHWNEKMLLESLGQEIQDVLEVDNIKVAS